LQSKIAARQVRDSSVIGTADILRQQAFERIQPIHEAVSSMVENLATNAAFATVFGRAPAIDFKWSDVNPSGGRIVVSGPISSFHISTSYWPAYLKRSAQTKLKLSIHPGAALGKILGCGFAYGSATPVEGYVEDLSGFLVNCEDMIAEFLADVVVMTDLETGLEASSPDA
jgi:hypothetical protein